MSASVCLSFSYDVCKLSRDERNQVSDFIRYKHHEAMKRAHAALCPDYSSPSAVQEALDSVRQTPQRNID